MSDENILCNNCQKRVEQAEAECSKLRAENEELLQRLKIQSNNKSCIDVGIQTGPENEFVVENNVQIGPQLPQDWRLEQQGTSNEQMSVADMVRSAAEQTYTEQTLPGFTLQENGLYYNYDSGYYYDTSSQLFYHPTTGQYYYYDENTEQYEVWQQPTGWSSRKYGRLAARYGGVYPGEEEVFEVLMDVLDKVEIMSGEKKHKRTYDQLMTNGDPDDPQFLEEVIDLTSENSDSDSDESEMTAEMMKRRDEEREANRFPPCIRLMEWPESNLHIVTITGAIFGRTTDCTVKIENEDTISRKHATITYSEDRRRYYLEDMGSKHGTKLNGQIISKARVRHFDQIHLGNKLFIVHLHSGNNTCAQCEPGLVQRTDIKPEPKKLISKEKSRKKQLKQMKKNYGLEGADYVTKNAVVGDKYSDRAAHRRKTEGSEHPSTQRPVAPASVNRAITSENKGFKMLSKMGWTEGKSLGKKEQGIKEPIAPSVQFDKAGLGAANHKVSLDINPAEKQKAERLMKTRTRYQRAPVKDMFDEDIQELKQFKSAGDKNT